MNEGPLGTYRTPAGIVFAVLGLAVALGGAGKHSGILFVLGLLTVLFGGRAVEYMAAAERASWRERWGRMLDRLSDPTCLLLTLVGAGILLGGLWGGKEPWVAVGLVVIVVGHIYVIRGRGTAPAGDASGPGGNPAASSPSRDPFPPPGGSGASSGS